MSLITDFYNTAAAGGLKPKFQEFLTSGIFTPSQALLDAGGVIKIFIVGSGQNGGTGFGGCGGEVIIKYMTLSILANCIVIIGAAPPVGAGLSGGLSKFAGLLAGGFDIIANSGVGLNSPNLIQTAGFGSTINSSAGSGILGFGVGGAAGSGGISNAKPNSGSGSGVYGNIAGSGYCLITWGE